MAKKQLKLMILVVTVFLYAISAPAQQQQPESARKKPAPPNVKQLIDLIWEKSEIDYKNLKDYVFSETEVWMHDKFKQYSSKDPWFKGPQITPNFTKEYIWIYKDGSFLRSPVKMNGADVAPADKKEYETKWIKKYQQKETIKSIYDYFYGIALSDYMDAIYIGGTEKWGGVMRSESNIQKILKKQMKHCQIQGKQRFEDNDVLAITCKSNNQDALNRFYETEITLLILPEEKQLVEFEKEYSMEGFSHGRQTLTLGKTMGNIWLPRKYSYNGDQLGSSFRYSKEFHSFKKAHVETNLSFDDSKTLREDVKSKTQFDMKTPVPPKEETSPSQKDP